MLPCRQITHRQGEQLLGAVHILRNMEWGGCLPDLLQYYIGGGLPNLLQYYSFERKMEGSIPFSALN